MSKIKKNITTDPVDIRKIRLFHELLFHELLFHANEFSNLLKW